jgi:hypothetical protein
MARLKDIELPERYSAVPFGFPEPGGPLEFCLIVNQGTGAESPALVELRENWDSRVFLGCIRDRSGRVWKLVEIWFQDVSLPKATLSPDTSGVTNLRLDEAWSERASGWSDIIRTGWEQPRGEACPLIIDLAGFTCGPMLDPRNGQRWSLCTDDKLLETYKLPAYSKSLTRYLYQPGENVGGQLIPVVRECPEGPATVPIEAIFPQQSYLPVNLHGGGVIVRDLYPIPLEAYVDLLGGGKWPGLIFGENTIGLGGIYDRLREGILGDELLVMSRNRSPLRVLEVFHLKTALIASLLDTVKVMSRSVGRPFLNLSPQSFAVSLTEMDRPLPAFWSAQTAVIDSGMAISVDVGTSGEKVFTRRSEDSATSAYEPSGVGAYSEGNEAKVQLKNLKSILAGEDEADGRMDWQDRTEHFVLEGTVKLPHYDSVFSGQWAYLRIRIKNYTVDFYSRLTNESGIVSFTSVPVQISTAAAQTLREKFQFAGCFYRVFPALGYPCDLYSMGILAARLLFVNETNDLHHVTSEFLEMASYLSKTLPLQDNGDESGRLAQACQLIEGYYLTRPNLQKILGPLQFAKTLVEADAEISARSADTAAKELFDHFPQRLLWESLLAVLRMLSGEGGVSIYPDLAGDPHPDALTEGFDKSIAAWNAIATDSRAILFGDYTQNFEIQSLLDRILIGEGS